MLSAEHNFCMKYQFIYNLHGINGSYVSQSTYSLSPKCVAQNRLTFSSFMVAITLSDIIPILEGGMSCLAVLRRTSLALPVKRTKILLLLINYQRCQKKLKLIMYFELQDENCT